MPVKCLACAHLVNTFAEWFSGDCFWNWPGGHDLGPLGWVGLSLYPEPAPEPAKEEEATK